MTGNNRERSAHGPSTERRQYALVIVAPGAAMQGDRRTPMSAAHNALGHRGVEERWHQGTLNAIEACLALTSVRHVSHTGMRGGRDLEKEGMLCPYR